MIDLNQIKQSILGEVQKVGQGFKNHKTIQPQDNFVSQVGRSPVGQVITNFQRGIETRTLPKVNLQQYTTNIKAPVPRVAAQFGAGIAQDFINTPQRLLEGGGRIGTQIVRPLQEGRQINPWQAVGAVASAAIPLVDLATLGGGTVLKGIGKQAVQQGGKIAIRQAIKTGAIQGGAMGGIYGALSGAAQGNQTELGNVLTQGGIGAAAGGVLGGGVAGVGHGLGAVMNAVRKVDPTLTEKEVIIQSKNYLRNKATGQFASKSKKPFVAAGMTQRDGVMKVNKMQGDRYMQQIDDELGNFDIPQIGLSMKDINTSPKLQRELQAAKGALTSEATKTKYGKIKISNIPTQTEIQNRAELARGNPDLYDQRVIKIANANEIDNGIVKGNPEPLPWEANSFGQPRTNLKITPDGKTQPKIKISGQSKSGSKPIYLANSSAAKSPDIYSSNGKVTQNTDNLNIPTDKATQQVAEARTLIGNDGKGGMSGFDAETKDAFQGWVNARRATKVEGFLKNKEFADLDKQGIQGFFKVQAGDTSGKLGKVRQYLDTKYAQLKKEGIDFNYQRDYLPQQWDNSEQEIAQVFGRSLGTRPGFTLEKVIKDYETGIAAGLKPKFNTIGQLVGWYEERANKALADKKFFDYTAKSGMLQPSSKAPQEWVTIDPDRFPKVKVNIDDTKYIGTYKAPKELADRINNYLRDPQFAALESIANYVSRVKNIALNFGIPGTAINAHGINILARHTLFGTGSNPVNRFITGAKYMVHPGSAEKYLDTELAKAPAAVKNGLTMSAEDYTGIGKQAENLAGQFSKKWEDVFGTPLFNKMLPALKLSSYEQLVKNGMSPKEAAKLSNNVYGGINWEQMGRSRDIQNLLRAMILAPDWGETTVRLAGNFGKALNPLHKSEVANRYRVMMATFLGSYVAMNIANKLTSGHYAYENAGGHTFELEAGYTDDGEKRYIRPYGTAMDMVRIPYDIVKGLKDGDASVLFRTLRNRVSIPLGVGIGAVTDTDYRGQAIGYRGTDKWGNEMPLKDRAVNIGSEAMSLVGFPSFLKQFGSSATGQQGIEQGLTQGFELPFRYSNTGNSALQKQTKFLADEQGLKGKELYDFNQTLQGQKKLGENQFNAVKQGGIGTLNNILTARKSTKSDDEIKQQFESGGQGIVNDKLYYNDNGSVKSFDLTPPYKGEGIKAFVNSDWKEKQAAKLWNTEGIDQKTKNQIFKKWGIDPKDAEYAALTSFNSDISAQYIESKSPDHETLLQNIISGRVVGITGKQFADNGVIDRLVDMGQLSKQEASYLKKVKLIKKDGKLVRKLTGRVGKKISLAGLKKPVSDIKLKSYKTPTVKLATRSPKVKVSNVSFDTPFSTGAIPQAPNFKTRIKFNL